MPKISQLPPADDVTDDDLMEVSQATSAGWVSRRITLDRLLGGSVAVGAEPPADPVPNSLWWNSDRGELFIWYVDQDSGQWVPATPSSSAGGTTEVNAQWFGVKADGVNDDSVPLQAAIDSFAPYAKFTTTGVKIVLPRGRLKFGSTVTMNTTNGLHIEGAGPMATECFVTTDIPVFSSTNVGTNPLYSASISNMTLRGNGLASTNSFGVAWTFTNRCRLENLVILGCRRGLYLSHMYESKVANVHVLGGGSDQSYDGFYLDSSDLTYIDNTSLFSDCVVQGVANDGYRIINGQGSRFVNCEAGGCGGNGWDVMNPASGTVKSQWLHFANCLSDSNALTNFKFTKGTATEAGEFIMVGTWSGNSGEEGLLLDGMTDVAIDGFIGIGLDKEVIKLVGCTRVNVSGVVARLYNRENGGFACIKLEDSTNCVVNGVAESSAFARSAVTETGTSDNNMITNISTQPTLVGTGTSFFGALGAYGAQVRAGANASFAIVGGAANTAYLGMGTTANPLLNNIARVSGNSVEVYTNSGRRWSFGNGVAEAGFVNTTDQPIQLYKAVVASLPAWGATSAGRIMWATNGRNSAEGAGAGTGCLVYLAGTVWMAAWSGLAVTA